MRTVRIHVAVLIVLSLLPEIVRFFDYEIREFRYANKTYFFILPTDLYRSRWYQLFYRILLMSVLRKFLPIVLAGVLTVCLLRCVWRLSRAGEAAPAAGVTRSLVTVVAFMVALHVPAAVYPLLLAFLTVPPDPCSHAYHYFATVAEALAALNSALNFYIYYLAMPTLRAELATIRRSVKCLCCSSDNKVSAVTAKISVHVIQIDKSQPKGLTHKERRTHTRTKRDELSRLF